MTAPPRNASFQDLFGRNPEASARAPGRVNLMGDHTDYNDGFVLPVAIPQETLVELAMRGGQGPHEAYSTTLGRQIRFDTADKDTPLQDFARYVGGCIRVVEERGVEVPSLSIRVSSDVPVGVSLSSSAALEVATLRALDKLLHLGLDPITIARLGQKAEIEHAGMMCGILDQMACSLATADRMMFLDTRSMESRLVALPAGAEILVVESGTTRELTKSGYNERRQQCEAAAAMLGLASLRDLTDPALIDTLPSPLRQRVRHVFSENARVLAALDADPKLFGTLMNASHASLRDDYEVSVAPVDALVAWLQDQPDIYGARMTGGGFGGACVALVPKGRAAEIGRRTMAADLPQCPARQVVVPQVAI